MDVLFGQLVDLLLTSPYSQYVIAGIFLAKLFVWFAPVSLTEKIPDKVMVLINILAVSISKVKPTDLKGNLK